jgi:hypothetical protein
MIETSSYIASASGSIAVLFHPSAVPVMDVFRSLGAIEDQYDLALLDGPEQALAAYTRPEAAKGIVSDALLLAFALTRQRGRAFSHRPLKSRHGSLDEYCLMVLISSARFPASEVTFEAATALGIGSLDFMPSLAGELIRQIDLGALVFDVPSLPEFRAVTGHRVRSEETILEASGRPDRHFKI